MAQNYKAGLIITGDASGGIRAIKATEDELGKLNQGFDRGSRQSKRFGSDAARAGQQLTEIDKGAGVAARGLQTLRRAAAPIAGAIAGMFAANTIKNQVDWGDQLQKTNLRIGASTEALSQYNYVAKLSGVEFGQLTTAWQRQTRRIAEAAQGTGVAAAALDRLNLSAKDLNRLAPEQQFERIAAAMQGVEDSSERVRLAQQLWDSEGVKLVQIVNQGTDAIAQMRVEADALGLTISQDTANAMASYNDEMDRLKFAAQGVSQTLAAELVPSMTAGLQATNAFIQQVGGAEAILDTATDAATMLAVVMGGRLAGALVTSTKRMVADTTATIAKARADATATTAARAKAAETLRVAQADQAAASRALANGHAIAIATGNTTLRTKAITQMAAANQRAIAAEAAHTAAVNVNSAAMARGTVAAQGMAAATRTGASALALIGGPTGAALIAGAGLYYFREELGLTDDKMHGTISTIESLGDSFIKEFGSLSAELMGGFNGIRGGLIDLDASFLDMKAGALESFSGIVSGSADLINMGLIPIQHALNALDQGFADWINRFANAFESAGAMPFGMANLFGEQVSRMRNMADGLTEGLIEPIGISTAALDSNAQAWRDQADAMRGTAVAIRNGTTPATQESITVFKTLDDWLFKTTESTDESTDSNVAATAATREAAKQTTSLANSYESLLDRIQPNRRAARQYAQDVGVLNLALATGRMNTVQYMQAMGQLQESFQAAQRETEKTAQASEDAGQRIANSFTTWETVADNTLRSVDDAGRDAWLGLVDGSTSALDTVERAFQQTFANIAHMLTTQQLTFQVAGMMGLDATGMPGGQGGGMQNMFNNMNPGMLQNGWNTVSGWFGGGSAAASGGGLYANAATGAAQGGLYGNAATGGLAQNGGGWMSSAGGAMQSLGAGYAGMQVGNQLAPDAKYGNAAGTVGAAIGSIWGPIGAAIGGAIAAPISKGLFGGSWQTKDGGLNLGVSGGDITGNQYEYQRKSGGLFRGSSYRTQTSALGGEFEAALQQAYSAQEASLAITLDVLGQQSSSLNAFSTGLTKISTKGKSEAEVEQAVQDWLQNIVNRAAQSVVDPAEYALAGETTIETLNRLATALTGVNPLLEQLHGAGYEASLAGGDAAASLVALSGGMAQFAQRADYYYQNFYTEAERHDAVMTQAAKALGAFTSRTGEVVTTTDQLRELVDGIDRNSEAGRELYAAAMELAPALVEVEQGLERVKDRFADMLNEANNALESAEQQVQSAYQAFDRQAYQQQLTLLGLVGDAETALALQREKELAGIDPLLHETQRVIWAIEDETRKKQNAIQASQNYASALSRVNSQLDSTFGNIAQWVDQQNATSGTPGLNLTEAGDQFARQLILAQSGDRSALQSITQYAEQYLSAGEAMYASGGAFQRIQQDVLDALQDLPDQISAEEFIAEEVKQALREQTQGISTQLGDVLRGDNPSNIAGELAGYFDTLAGGIDGVLTPEQLAIVMSGKATDAELAALMRAVDLNGNGVMSGLESVIIAGMPTDAVLGTVLRNKMNELDKNQLTHAQIRSALSPIASDAEIKALIQRVDVNGDGIISRQELTAGRIGGLASGIAKGLNPAFDMLDSNLDGKLTFAELSAGLEGMATDAQIKAMMRSMDLTGDGVISGLESVIIAGMPTDAVLGTLLRNKMNDLDKNQLTHAQIRSALSPIASDAEIKALIQRVDKNGDGIISKQELTAGRIGGLASGIGSTLAPMFDAIDLDASGLIDWSEFYATFAGIASDEELRRIFNKLDADGSGQISRLEALKKSSDGTEGNTKSLEERARDQLQSLDGLTSEMARTTDQFAGLNSNIVSLRDSINALGVAQEEVARIERERAEAEARERKRIDTQRAISGFEHASDSHRNKADSLENSGRIDHRDIGNITALVDKHWNNDGWFSHSEWERVLDHLAGVFGHGSLEYNYGREYAAMYRNRSRANEYRDRLDGSHATGLWNVPFDGYVAELHADEMVVPAKTAGMLRDLPTRELPMPNIPMPQFPALGHNDVLQVLQDVRRELVETRKQNKQLQEENNRHAAAAVAVQQAGFSGQINELTKANQSLDDMSAAARLEGSR